MNSSRVAGSPTGGFLPRLILTTAAMLLSGWLVCPSGHGEACVPCFVDSRVVSTNASKCGFETFIPTAPPRLYLTMVTEHSRSNIYNSTDVRYQSTVTDVIDVESAGHSPYDNCGPGSAGFDRTFSGSASYSHGGFSCQTEQDQHGTWDPSDCLNVWVWPAVEWMSWDLDYRNETESRLTGSWGVPPYEGYGGVHTESLHDEYTDAMLRQRLLSRLPAWGDWQPGFASAFLDRTEDHVCVQGGRMAYRFRVPHTGRDITCRIVWDRIYRKFQHFGWGQGLTEIQEGDPAAPRTVTYNYYSTPNFVPNGTVLPIETVTFPDGSWERFQYDSQGRVTLRLFSFLNQAPTWNTNLCRSTTYSYTPLSGSGDNGSLQPHTPRTVIDRVLGHETARRYTVLKTGERRDIRCRTPGAAWTAADNLVTLTTFHTSGPNLHRVASVRHPDGTMTFHTYTDNIDGTRTTVTDNGQPNVGLTAILDGLRHTTIIGPLGQAISQTTTDIASGLLLSSQTYSSPDPQNPDPFGRPERVTYLDGTFTDAVYACCGIDHTVDRDGATTLYSYDPLGRHTATLRHGVTTTNLTYTYDRRGRQRTVVQGAMTTTLHYNDANLLIGESYSGGILNGRSVTNVFDAFLRRTSLEGVISPHGEY